MPEQTPKQEKKIIVDEDWKSRVEQEREAARKQAPPTGSVESASAEMPLPPPSLTFLVGNLYLQGMIALGLLPSPGKDRPEVHLDQAKHTIGLIEMLEQKTAGNRTPEETRELENVLHELRLSYVTLQKQHAAQPGGSQTPESS